MTCLDQLCHFLIDSWFWCTLQCYQNGLFKAAGFFDFVGYIFLVDFETLEFLWRKSIINLIITQLHIFRF